MLKDFRGKVVVARDKALRSSKGELIQTRVEDLFRRALEKLSGGSEKDFWKSLLSGNDTIGLKVNCLAGRRLSTTPHVARAIISSLERAGFDSRKIIVWDRSDKELLEAGFPLRYTGSQWRCYGTDRVGYERRISISGEVGSCLSRILTRSCTVLISIGVLKDHDLAGVSAGMKNLFGVIHNPNKYHDNTCDPYVADLLRMPEIKRKLVLTVVDGTLAQCHNGPGYSPPYAWNYNGLLVGTDPVAVDRIACEILEKKRRTLGLVSFAEAGRWPKYLKTAGSYGLGEADLKKIKVMEEGDV